MFGELVFTWSQHARHGGGQVLSEVVATFGLLLVIIGCARRHPKAVPQAVASYIVAAYWFIGIDIVRQSGRDPRDL